MATAASPVPAATPIEQRQWRKQAQRSVRLALTAFKDARSRYHDASSTGLQHATALSNALLTQHHLTSMPLGALKGMPGLLEAAAWKLGVHQQGAVQKLQSVQEQLQAAVSDMQAALEDVAVNGSCDTCQAYKQHLPVFNSIALPLAAGMLGEVLRMYQRDLQSKQQLMGGLERAMAEAAGGASSSGTAGRSADEHEQRLKMYLSCWLAKPYVDEGRADHLLLVLTDDMAGF